MSKLSNKESILDLQEENSQLEHWIKENKKQYTDHISVGVSQNILYMVNLYKKIKSQEKRKKIVEKKLEELYSEKTYNPPTEKLNKTEQEPDICGRDMYYAMGFE